MHAEHGSNCTYLFLNVSSFNFNYIICFDQQMLSPVINYLNKTVTQLSIYRSLQDHLKLRKYSLMVVIYHTLAPLDICFLTALGMITVQLEHYPSRSSLGSLGIQLAILMVFHRSFACKEINNGFNPCNIYEGLQIFTD